MRVASADCARVRGGRGGFGLKPRGLQSDSLARVGDTREVCCSLKKGALPNLPVW